MSGGIRMSVKSYLNAKRLGLSEELDKKQERDETIIGNFKALQALHLVPEKSVYSTSFELSICDAPSTSPIEGEILLKRFLLKELKTATWNFYDQNKLGEGGFGSVFKGWIDDNSPKGMLIAVKTINKDGLQGHKEWLTEIHYLGRFRHPNIVKLLGYCFEDDQRILVYEFMPRGSLETLLFGAKSNLQPLSWILRMKIALGAAKSLAFIHSGEGKVIHRDFKCSNILVDSNYNAKLSDFGFAKDGPAGGQSHVSTRVIGTYGYAAPEYIATGHLTNKNDVYGFGVVLLELLCGKQVLDTSRPTAEHDLVEWAKPYLTSKHKVVKILDVHMKGQYSVAAACKVANLTSQCLSASPKLRPNMNEVVYVLEQLQESSVDDIDSSVISQCQTPQANSGSVKKSSNRWRRRISFRPSTSFGHLLPSAA